MKKYLFTFILLLIIFSVGKNIANDTQYSPSVIECLQNGGNAEGDMSCPSFSLLVYGIIAAPVSLYLLAEIWNDKY